MQNENEAFDLSISYHQEELTFPCVFSAYGYSYRITVNVEGTEVIFEPDEERNFRARIEQVVDLTARTRQLINLAGAELGRLFHDQN